MQNEQNLSIQNQPDKKPKWLRKLEEESWQAELIISGLAIFAALQMPHYINELVDWSITFFHPKNYFWARSFFLYLFCASNILIICFIAHFILRAIWIGMLGLNYVFPKGINYDFKQYSPYFLKKLEEQFPNNYQDIIQLEKACSAMFGVATMATIVIFAINLDILILFGLKTIFEKFLSGYLINILGSVLFFAIMLFMPAMIIMNLKRFHHNEKIQHWYFKIGQFFNMAFYNFLYYPITRITFLFVTNSSIKKFGIWAFGISLALGIFSSAQMGQSNIGYLSASNRLHHDYARTDFAIANHYESNLNGSQKLLSAVIPSEKIEDDLLKIFVPIFSNEKVMMDSLCGKWDNQEHLNREEKRQKRAIFWLTCAQQYHQFYVNDSLYSSDLVRYEHPNRGEDGILTYLPTQNFKIGKNILRIEKIKNDSTIYRTINIPFWFSAD